MKRLQLSIISIGALIAVTGASTAVHADGLSVAPIKDPTVAQECSACHMIYPAGLLPAGS